MTDDLKPCPFCGCMTPEVRYDMEKRAYYVYCAGCDAMGGDRSNRSYAISVWNKRYGE